eukprot:4543276-Prymnesium_polylepis.2
MRGRMRGLQLVEKAALNSCDEYHEQKHANFDEMIARHQEFCRAPFASGAAPSRRLGHAEPVVCAPL